MNFSLEILTSKENLNMFSTPKFRENFLDKNQLNKNNFIQIGLNSKLLPGYGTINEELKNIKEISKENNSINTGISIRNSKGNNFIQENFSLSSLAINNNINGSNKDKIYINGNISDSNAIKYKDKDDKDGKNDEGLFSFCDKIDNFSFNNEINSKDIEKESNYSCSTNKKRREINLDIHKNIFHERIKNFNNNLKLKTEINIKDPDIKTSSSNKNNSGSFKYNLPLENDKIPIIKDFFIFQDNNNNILEDKNNKNNTINNNSNNININNKNIENKSLELNNNHIDKNNINVKKNESIKEITNKKSNILFHYKTNYNMNFSRKNIRKSQTQKLCKVYKLLPIIKKINEDNENNFQNKTFLEKSIKNSKNKKLKIKNSILHSCENNKVKKKIKIYSSEETENKESKNIILSEINNSKIISPKKKLEIIIKNTEIDINDKILNINSREKNNNKKNYNSTTEQSIKHSLPYEIEAEFNKYKKLEKNLYIKDYKYKNNINKKNKCSKSTNKMKHKNKKFIKTPTLDSNKTFFESNKLKNLEDKTNIKNNDKLSKTNDKFFINKKINISSKRTIANNFINKENKENKTNKDINVVDNKKYSCHTRNISNLYSNKIFNGIKNIFNNNNDIIFNTINYENNDINRKEKEKKILQTQFTNNSKNKKSNERITHIKDNNETKVPLDKNLNKKEKTNLYFKNNNISFNSNFITNNINTNNHRYNTITFDKNKINNDKKALNFQQKIKINNLRNSDFSNFNKIKTILINKRKNTIKIENKNQSSKRLIANNINKSIDNINNNTNNNYSSVNLDIKKHMNDSIFINVNDSSNSLQNNENSKFNKIKVNTINMHKKILKDLYSNTNKQNSSYLKISKKSKNSCLLNNYNKNTKKLDNINSSNTSKNHISLGCSYENHIKGNSQIINFNKNKAKKSPELNLNEKIHHFNISNNSKSIITEYSFTERNNISIDKNLNIEKTKEEMRNGKYNNNINMLKINQNNYKLYKKNKRQSYKNKSSELFSTPIPIKKEDIDKTKIIDREEIIKYSILRNNQNNKIINEFSVVVGDEKMNKSENKITDIISSEDENKVVFNKYEENSNTSSGCKKTIINVNQFYPSYYINTSQIITKKSNIKK